MFGRSISINKVTEMGCCGCFGFSLLRHAKKGMIHNKTLGNNNYRDSLLNHDVEDERDENFRNVDVTDGENVVFFEYHKRAEEILKYRVQYGLICREFPVKETYTHIRSEDENGNKTVNEYIRECKIGAGSYGKVALYRSQFDGKHYEIKGFHKSHLLKLRVAPSETAMTDVSREVLIMKVLSHPNIVNLVEVIDDPTTDNLYMVLEYVEGKWVCKDDGNSSCLDENTARKYLRDVVSGLMYLHAHVLTEPS